MPQIDYILTRLRQPNVDDARQVLYAIGEWLAVGDRESLGRVYDRIRELAREGAIGLATEAALRGARTVLDGYFATRESIERVDRLVRDVAAQPLWQQMLNLLAASPVASLDAAAAHAKHHWDDLRLYELVEVVPVGVEFGYGITRLGRRVLEAVMRADQAVPR